MLARAVVPMVRVDDPAAGRLGAEHLVERGFRHFAFYGFADYSFSDVRCDGFTEVIRRAERILSDTDLAIPEAARASGFRSPSHFSSALRRVTGLTPNAYRQKYHMR